MTTCFFVSDLHGSAERYRKLWETVEEERPAAVFLGGDLLPHPYMSVSVSEPGWDFLDTLVASQLRRLHRRMRKSYPLVFAILGNDDARSEEEAMLRIESEGLWNYAHGRRIVWDRYLIFGYAYVPPTPFLLKDWERYDVSRFVDPGSISPEEGHRTVPVSTEEVRYATIAHDLDLLAGAEDLTQAIFLFHAPPYGTVLDRADLDGQMVEWVPLDLHVGSIAVRRFIEERRPRITLHGHVHEAARLTGEWKVRLGGTYAYTAAHDGSDLALVRFNPEQPAMATREFL
jgi:Icc-related predicted phosphoesterase